MLQQVVVRPFLGVQGLRAERGQQAAVDGGKGDQWPRQRGACAWEYDSLVLLAHVISSLLPGLCTPRLGLPTSHRARVRPKGRTWTMRPSIATMACAGSKMVVVAGGGGGWWWRVCGGQAAVKMS